MGQYDYKIQQLQMMQEAARETGFAAKINQDQSNAKTIDVDADALKILIKYYSDNNYNT